MAVYTFVSALRNAFAEARRAKSEARAKALGISVRAEIIAVFNSLPAQRQAEMVGSILSHGDLTDDMLRRFVQTCPNDKYVTVIFPKGETITITGAAPDRRGPGW